MQKKFHNQFRTESIRAKWHDYGNGVYFITICTKNMVHYFGEITCLPYKDTTCSADVNKNTMQFSKIGRYLNEQIGNISSHNPYARIPVWVVMPNHVHLLVIIDGKKTPYPRRCQHFVKPWHTTAADISNLQGWLSVTIGGLKSSITRYANENHIGFAWQTRFYDCIIRDEEDWNSFVHYIENNVKNWETDCHPEFFV